MPNTLPGRVLFVVHVDKESGPQRSLMPRLQRLVEEGAEITTLVPGPGPAAELAAKVGDVITDGPEALTIPQSAAAVAKLPADQHRQAKRVERVTRLVGAEVVIVSSALSPAALIGATQAGASTLLYAGEILPDGGLKGRFSHAVMRVASRYSNAIIAPSSAAAAPYRARDIEVPVVHPTIELPDDDPEELTARARELRSRLGIPHDRKLICSLGAITHGRGQDTLIEAAVILRNRGLEFSLIIAGEPYDRPRDLAFRKHLGRLVTEAGLDGQVVFPGRITDTAALFTAANLFVNPARVPESFGRAALEALSCGCPVVSTHTGGTPSALTPGKTALLVSPHNPDELSDAVDRLLCNRHFAATLVQEGQREIATRFASDVSETAFILTVDRALSVSNPGSSG